MTDATTPVTWLLEGLIPAGATVTITDDDDPDPLYLMVQCGFDVVLRLHGRGAMDTEPVLLSTHWRHGLVAGHHPPAPMWIRFNGHGFERVTEGTA